MEFSVLLSVYSKESPLFLEQSLESVLNNTIRPSQIVLVKDGALTDRLDEVIRLYKNKYNDLFTIVELKENVGLGKALNIGLTHVKYEIVARMDSDDICVSTRFQRQIEYMLVNANVSVVGTSVFEFNKIPGDLNQKRSLPETNQKLLKFAKYRNPLNHPTVMFRKKDIMAVGSYLDMKSFEDYYLWIRLLSRRYKIGNLPVPLLYFRIGNDMVGRRKGYGYAKNEITFLRAMRKIGFISKLDFLFFLLVKIPLRMLPKKILNIFYKNILR